MGVFRQRFKQAQRIVLNLRRSMLKQSIEWSKMFEVRVNKRGKEKRDSGKEGIVTKSKTNQ